MLLRSPVINAGETDAKQKVTKSHKTTGNWLEKVSGLLYHTWFVNGIRDQVLPQLGIILLFGKFYSFVHITQFLHDHLKSSSAVPHPAWEKYYRDSFFILSHLHNPANTGNALTLTEQEDGLFYKVPLLTHLQSLTEKDGNKKPRSCLKLRCSRTTGKNHTFSSGQCVLSLKKGNRFRRSYSAYRLICRSWYFWPLWWSLLKSLWRYCRGKVEPNML